MEEDTKKSTAKKYWNIIRTLGFYLIGILNTVLIQPEDIGSWKNYAGYGVLLIAILDTIGLIRKLTRKN